MRIYNEKQLPLESLNMPKVDLLDFGPIDLGSHRRGAVDLLQRFEAVRERLFATNYLVEVLSRILHAPGVQLELASLASADPYTATLSCRFPDLRGGFNRPNDDQILATVVEKISNSTSPVECLELGAGQTFPLGGVEAVGSPWLSRCLQIAFGNHSHVPFRMTATDHIHQFRNDYCIPSDHVSQIVDEERLSMGQTYAPAIACFHVLPTFRNRALGTVQTPVHLYEVPIEPVTATEFSLTPLSDLGIPVQELRSYGDSLNRLMWRHVMIDRYGDFRRDVSGRLVVREPLDAEIEQAIFGLRAIGNVTFGTASSIFGNRSFDVVFARHLPPSFVALKDLLVESIFPLLKRDGVAILTFDTSVKDDQVAVISSW